MSAIVSMLIAVFMFVAPGADVAWAKKEQGNGPGHPHPNGGPKSERNHCISPGGVDLNRLFGVSEQIITFFCNQMETGERWRPGAIWIVGPSFASVPPGFSSTYPTPLADFVAKLVRVRYVVDPDTRHARSYTFPNSSALFIADAGGGDVGINTVTLGVLHPLPPGEHLVRVFWTFSATHCDGLGTVPAENCFPAGETLYAPTQFTVSSHGGN